MDDQNKEMKMRNSLVQNTKQVKLKKKQAGRKVVLNRIQAILPMTLPMTPMASFWYLIVNFEHISHTLF